MFAVWKTMPYYFSSCPSQHLSGLSIASRITQARAQRRAVRQDVDLLFRRLRNDLRRCSTAVKTLTICPAQSHESRDAVLVLNQLGGQLTTDGYSLHQVGVN